MAMFWREQSFTQQQMVMRDFSQDGKLQSLAPRRIPGGKQKQAGERGSPFRCHSTHSGQSPGQPHLHTSGVDLDKEAFLEILIRLS